MLTCLLLWGHKYCLLIFSFLREPKHSETRSILSAKGRGLRGRAAWVQEPSGLLPPSQEEASLLPEAKPRSDTALALGYWVAPRSRSLFSSLPSMMWSKFNLHALQGK